MSAVKWGVLGAANFAREHMAPAINAAKGAELIKSVRPEQQIVKIVHDDVSDAFYRIFKHKDPVFDIE